MYELLLFFVSIGAGFLGALLGLGGGIIVVPALTLLYHVNIRYAIAARNVIDGDETLLRVTAADIFS